MYMYSQVCKKKVLPGRALACFEAGCLSEGAYMPGCKNERMPDLENRQGIFRPVEPIGPVHFFFSSARLVADETVSRFGHSGRLCFPCLSRTVNSVIYYLGPLSNPCPFFGSYYDSVQLLMCIV